MKNIVLGLLFLTAHITWSQQAIRLIISPKVQHSLFQTGEKVTDLSGRSMNVQYFMYYLSDLHLYHDGNQDLDLSDTVFIVRAENFTLDLGMLNITNLEKISFAVGVPEPLNHLDISVYPDKHPLGFQVPSMHWGWTDGYMFMIVGGLTDGDADNEPETDFQLHNFGDANYYHVEIPVTLTPNTISGNDILLDCNLDEWIGALDLPATGIKHGSTDLNATILKNVSTRPVFTLPQTAGLSTPEIVGKVKTYTDGNGLQVVWEEMLALNKIELIDVQGKKILEMQTDVFSGSKNLGKLNEGIYFISFYSKQGSLLQQLKVLY